jgi:hypothetical protein
MKNFKQIAFGLVVGALALGFSAFTNAHRSGMVVKRDANGKVVSVTATYFRLPGNASTSTDMTASHYVFSDGALADCNPGTNDICKSNWATTIAPVDGQSPVDAGSPSFVSNETQKGIYNGQ